MIGTFSAISAVISLICAIFTGNTSSLASSLVSEPAHAVETAVFLAGGMAFWSGIMRVAERSGVMRAVSEILKKPLKIIFGGIDTEGRGFGYICMNISANMLGLGNAATPLGIEAMKALDEEAPDEEISDNMVIFAVMNTSSLTLIPTTMASLRLKYGACEPFDVMPAVILTSAVSLTAAIAAAKAGCIIHRMEKKRR